MPLNVALVGLVKDLLERADSGRPITVGLIGCGEMGTDIVTRIAHMPGLRLGVVAERRPPAGRLAGEIAYGEPGHTRQTAKASEVSAAIADGKIAVVEDSELVLGAGEVDVVVDATGSPSAGAEIGLKAIEHGKHLVMMNVEADVTIGAYLAAEAQRRGLVYSLGAGDEPSSCMELIEFVSAMGHEVVCAGKGKNNPLDIDAVPDDYEAEAAQRNMNPRMLVEFVDGSKTMVEMAAIANATGLVPDVPGMHGPAATGDDLSSVLVPKSDGGILSDMGRVDYSVGKGVAPGVFVIAKMAHPRVWERLEDLKVGKGPYFTFMRPFHLTSMEVPLTCARVALYGRPDMVPLDRPVAEVCAVAKRDLKPGETLDRIGQYTYRSWTMRADEARAVGAIPCGMLEGGTVTAPLKRGDLITSANVSIPPDSVLARLRARQDAMFYGEESGTDSEASVHGSS